MAQSDNNAVIGINVLRVPLVTLMGTVELIVVVRLLRHAVGVRFNPSR